MPTLNRSSFLAAIGLISALLPATLSAAGRQAASPADVFLVKPYLQLGDAPKNAKSEALTLIWHAPDADADWAVEFQGGGEANWRKAGAPASRRVVVPTIEPHRVLTVTLNGLAPGKPFRYRVLKGGQPVFESEGKSTRHTDKDPYRFVVFGDCAAGTPAQRKIAYQTYQQKPDFVFITGDIVYSRGRISEYREKYFPVYNADAASPEAGAPLIRSTLFIAAPGNHDIGNRDLEKFPDGLAYFLYWSLPLNGPLSTPGAPSTPTLSGPEESQKAFTAAAGSTYPKMANYSFDYGNAHWTVIDANTYVDWNDPALRAWLEKDLAAAKKATWRFVGLHQPGFNSSKNHFNEQQMRMLAPVFEKGKVDVVFAGHVHNYQRTFPMTFAPAPGQTGKGPVAGEWGLDKSFDGKSKTKPSGVIYLVTGAGGANLYNPEIQTDPSQWQPFTTRYVAVTHSLTVIDVNGKTLKVRQVSEEGAEVDSFTVSK